jgi:glycosyltransferase involved in cell wall biosynthesis
MKIGMVLESFYPEDIRVTKEATALVQSGFEVYLLCERRESEKEYELIDGLHVIRVDIPSRNSLKGFFYRAYNAFFFRHQIWIDKIRNFIKEYSIDVIHVHDLPLYNSAYIVAKELNKKIVVDLHENYPDGLQVWTKWRKGFKANYIFPVLSNYKRWIGFEKHAVQSADVVITVVDEMRDRVANIHSIDRDKIVVVTNTEEKSFVDSAIIDAEVVDRYKEQFIVSYIGGVGYHRGIDTTIKSLKYIKDIDIKLLVVGGIHKDIKEYLDTLSLSEGVSEMIEYTSQVPFEKVYSYIQASDICLVPHNNLAHTNNTIPHKLFQYMMAKRAVITSSCPPLKKVIDATNAGEVFEADNPKDLAEKIRSIYTSPELLELYGNNGYEHTYNGIYNWENSSQELIKLYKNIM